MKNVNSLLHLFITSQISFGILGNLKPERRLPGWQDGRLSRVLDQKLIVTTDVGVGLRSHHGLLYHMPDLLVVGRIFDETP